MPVGTNGFGSGLSGSVFGSAAGSKPLSNFASGTVKSFQNQKDAKPFGAPDSDEGEQEDEDEDNGEDNDSNGAEKDLDTSPEKEQDDKSKVKLHRGESYNVLVRIYPANANDLQSTLMMARQTKPRYCQLELKCLSTKTALGRSAVLAC